MRERRNWSQFHYLRKQSNKIKFLNIEFELFQELGDKNPRTSRRGDPAAARPAAAVASSSPYQQRRSPRAATGPRNPSPRSGTQQRPRAGTDTETEARSSDSLGFNDLHRFFLQELKENFDSHDAKSVRRSLEIHTAAHTLKRQYVIFQRLTVGL